MNVINYVHGKYVFNRRVRVLSEHLTPLFPNNAVVLDVGCGDGLITHLCMEKRPDIQSQGIDVLIRNQTYIPVKPFDGQSIPYDDKSVDTVVFVDVLHHTNDPLVLLREAARVARQTIVLKDHTRDGWLAGETLRFMDKVGNERYGVALPYNYWSKQQWLDGFQTLGLQIQSWQQNLQLYPPPASWLFDRSLHFVTQLGVG